MNKTEQELYNRIYNMYRIMLNSNQFSEHKCIREMCWDFYDGNQWSAEELKGLAERNQAPIVINKIATKIDALSGLDQQRRTKTKYVPRNFSDESRLKADLLTALSYQIQEINDTSEQKANRFIDSAVGGLGWLRCSEKEGATITEYVPAEEMLWDVNDQTLDMSDQRMCARVSWVDPDELKAEFPAKASAIDARMKSMTEEATSEEQESTETDVSDYNNMRHNKLRVVEVQYKKVDKAYRFKGFDDNYKEVFDKDYADKNKKDGSDVLEISKDKIYDGYFIDGLLLAHTPLHVQVGILEYQPLVWKRRRRDLVPYGAVYSAIDPQKEINKRRSKMIHSLNHRQITADSEAFESMSKDSIRTEAARPDGVLLYKKGSEFQFVNNQGVADSQYKVMLNADVELQQTIGISDEMVGDPSNATSGVAIARRQTASVSKQSFIFNRLKENDKRIGKLLLAYMQNATRDTVVSLVGDNDMIEEVIVNQTYEKDGKEIIVRDLSTENFDVVVSEAPDYQAAPEEVADRMMTVLNSPQILQMLAQSPNLLKLLGVPNADMIVRELTGASQQQLAGVPDENQPSPANVMGG